MIFQKLQNDFKIRYFSDKTPACAFAGYPLFLLGDINIGYSSLSTALSAGTAIAFETTNNNTFSVQRNNDNTLFSCEINDLLSCHEDNFPETIFKIIGKLSASADIKFTGADMLFLHNTQDSHFHNYKSALLTMLFSLFFPGKPIEELICSVQNMQYSEKETRSVLTSLCSYQNSCIITRNRTYKQYPLPLYDKKIIIAKLSEKNPHICQTLKNALHSYKKYAVENNQSPELNSDLLYSDIPLTAKEKKILFFALNEEKRIKNYTNISDFGGFSSIINSSAEEMLDFLDCRPFSLLCKIFSNYTSAFRPMPEDMSVYCIIYNDMVDSFIASCAKEFEKKAGYKPTFFICDTASSGLGFGIMRDLP